MFLLNSAARRTAVLVPLKSLKLIFSPMPLYPGDGSDCDQPALKLVSEHAREQELKNPPFLKCCGQSHRYQHRAPKLLPGPPNKKA
jgi:hypothetical protein